MGFERPFWLPSPSPVKGDQICSATGGLCAVLGEPLCMTERPIEGWPSEEGNDA